MTNDQPMKEEYYFDKRSLKDVPTKIKTKCGVCGSSQTHDATPMVESVYKQTINEVIEMAKGMKKEFLPSATGQMFQMGREQALEDLIKKLEEK